MQYIFNACGKLTLLKSSSIQLQNKKDGKRAVIFIKKARKWKGTRDQKSVMMEGR